MAIRIETFTGPAMAPYFPDLARLRTIVFRTWPYMYDGRPETDTGQFNHYGRSPRAALTVAFDGDAAVGCSTCVPLADEEANIAAPFAARGLPLDRFFYLGESVLLPEYRGRGIGVSFFAEREAHASRMSDADFACFCSVRRTPDDPRRPADALPLDRFWARRGYAPLPDIACTMAWTEVGASAKIVNTLDFWGKSLTGKSFENIEAAG